MALLSTAKRACVFQFFDLNATSAAGNGNARNAQQQVQATGVTGVTGVTGEQGKVTSATASTGHATEGGGGRCQNRGSC